MSRRPLIAALALVAVAALLALAPEALAQSGNDVGENIGDLLRGYAAQVYGGVIAVISLIFLINRRYTDLGLFFLAAVLVAWLVFSPDQVARTARDIGDQVLP